MMYKEKSGKTVANRVNRLHTYLKIIKYYIIICTHIESVSIFFEFFLSW